jgi:hypothetical protein
VLTFRGSRVRFEERFWSRVDQSGPCWIWKAGRNYLNYGITYVAGNRYTFAHRVSWMLTHGDIPEGVLVLHECDNPPCVRPDHLHLGSAADNAKEASERGLLGSQDRHPTKQLANLLGAASFALIQIEAELSRQESDLDRAAQLLREAIEETIPKKRWASRRVSDGRSMKIVS